MSRYSRDRSRSRSARHDERKREPRYTAIPKLYAGNIDSIIPPDEIERDLRGMCEKFGDIIEINVKSKAGSDHSYAFVEFKVVGDAEKAVSNLKGTIYKGRQIKIELGRGGRKDIPSRPTEGCYVCGRDGHYARDCERERGGRRSRDRYRDDRRDDDRYQRKRSSSRDYARGRQRRDSRSRSRSRSTGRYRERERRRYSSSRSDERRRMAMRTYNSRSRSRSYDRNRKY